MPGCIIMVDRHGQAPALAPYGSGQPCFHRIHLSRWKFAGNFTGVFAELKKSRNFAEPKGIDKRSFRGESLNDCLRFIEWPTKARPLSQFGGLSYL